MEEASHGATMEPKAPTGSRVPLALAIAGVLSLFATGVAIIGSQVRIWDWTKGVAIAQYAGLAGLLIIVLMAIMLRSRHREAKPLDLPHVLAGGLAAAISLVYGANWLMAGLTRPAIHDISTNLASPPEFAVTPLRVDNLDQIPGAGDKGMAGLNPRQRWAAIHQRAYPALRSVRVEDSQSAVLERAKRVAADRGWNLASGAAMSDALEFRGSATLMRVPFIGVVRVQPVPNAAASVIDMRLVGESGRSDRGVLEPEISAFLANVSGTTTATRR